MKMVTAIINKKDAGKVCSALVDAGFYFTKTASSGGFLTIGNTTLIIGIEDDKLNEVLDIIRKHSSRRTETVTGMIGEAMTSTVVPTQVIVGGATVFVTNVELFEKM